MKTFHAAALFVCLAGPAYAQAQAPVPRYGEEDKAKTPGQIEQEKAAEKAYKNSLGTVSDKAAVDPWGSARSVGEPKTPKVVAKAAQKSRAKTGDVPN